MFQEWANRGLHYWEIDKTNVDLVEGQAEYKFFRSADDGTSATTSPTNPVNGVDDILEAALRNSKGTVNQSDTALTKINRSTYSGLSNKLSKGAPSQYYVQRFIDHTLLTLYPTPDTVNASKDLAIYFVKRIQDVGGYSNTADVPYRFVPCMLAGLSYYLSQKYKPELVQQMKLLYEDELQRALAEDGSSSSSFITPKTYYPNV